MKSVLNKHQKIIAELNFFKEFFLGKFIFWINLELIYDNNKKKNIIIYKEIC